MKEDCSDRAFNRSESVLNRSDGALDRVALSG